MKNTFGLFVSLITVMIIFINYKKERKVSMVPVNNCKFTSFNLFNLTAEYNNELKTNERLCISMDSTGITFNEHRKIRRMKGFYYESVLDTISDYEIARITFYIYKENILFYKEVRDLIDTNHSSLIIGKIYPDQIVKIYFRSGEGEPISPNIDINSISQKKLYQKTITKISINSNNVARFSTQVQDFDEIGSWDKSEIDQIKMATNVNDVIFWHYYYKLRD